MIWGVGVAGPPPLHFSELDVNIVTSISLCQDSSSRALCGLQNRAS